MPDHDSGGSAPHTLFGAEPVQRQPYIELTDDNGYKVRVSHGVVQPTDGGRDNYGYVGMIPISKSAQRRLAIQLKSRSEVRGPLHRDYYYLRDAGIQQGLQNEVTITV